MKAKYILRALTLLAATLFTACASYRDETSSIRSAWKLGNNKEAAELAADAANDNEESNDELVFLLEEGSAWRAANNFTTSNQTFSQANKLIKDYANEPDILLIDETSATFTNLTFLPYRGSSYDKIMLHTYVALNDMELGQIDSARVNLNRALFAQRDAVRENAENINEAQQQAREAGAQAQRGNRNNSNDSYDVERAQHNPAFQASIQRNYNYLNKFQGYADYVNPFSVFIDGLYFMATAQDMDDLERARKSLERVQHMVPNPKYVDQDIALVDTLISGQTIEPVTYVIFETGMAPSLTEIRIDIPLFIVSREVPYVGAAFPSLEFNSSYIKDLDVESAGSQYPTLLLCNMDNVIATAFENELPIIITRTLISAGAKAMAQYGLYLATKNSGALGTIVMVAGVLYQYAMNEADLRTWITLPKQFQYCRFNTPENGKIKLTSSSNNQTIEIKLMQNLINVVYVKSNTANAPFKFSQFILP